MAVIRILHDPSGIGKKETFNINNGELLFSWLLKHYGEDGFTVPTKLYKNNVRPENEIKLDDYVADSVACGYKIDSSCETIFIIHTPLGIETLIAIGFAVVAFVVALSIKIPEIPEIPEFVKAIESPNNSLFGQTNIARPLQRIPDIYGKNRVYPDLIAPSYFEFINHVKYQTEYMCIGRGKYLIENLKSGETLIGSIEGSSSTIFEPFTRPDDLLAIVEANAVNGQEVFAPNAAKLDITGVSVSFLLFSNFLMSPSQATDFNNLVPGDKFVISNASSLGATVNGSSDISFSAGSGSSVSGIPGLNFKSDKIGATFGLDIFNVGDILKIRNTSNNNIRVEVDTVTPNQIICVKVGTAIPILFINETPVNGILDSTGSDEITKPSGLNAFSVGNVLTINNTSFNDGVDYLVVNFVSATKLRCSLKSTGEPVLFTPELNTSATLNSAINNNGTFTFDRINYSSFFNLTEIVVQEDRAFTALFDVSVDFAMAGGTPQDELGPFAVPGNPDEVWVDIQAPRGLRTNAGGVLEVDLIIQLQEIDSDGLPIGSPENTLITLSDKIPDPRFYTFKVIPDKPGGLYEVKVIRTSNTEGLNNTLDQTKWTRLAGVEEVTVSDFGNITTILIQTIATDQATSIQERKFNAIVTRKLRSYDIESGVISPEIDATAKFADAILDILTDPNMGNKNTTEIDLDQLYAIQEKLDADPIYDDKLGRFCYSFSSDQTPVKDELVACANAARVFVYREGNIFKFVRDEKQIHRTTLFNKRNKKPDSENKSTRFRKVNDNDGVSLEWTDEDTGDGFVKEFPEDGSALNPIIIKGAGIKNSDQAWNRANYEFQRLLYSRTVVTTKVTKDGLIVDLNDKISNVDGTNITKQSGEIIGIHVAEVDTNEVIDFKGNLLASVILRSEDGSVSEVLSAAPRADTDAGFSLLTFPTFPILLRGDNDNQVGTLYTIEVEEPQTVNDYLVQEIIPSNDGYVTLKLINYAEEIYQADEQIPT